MRIRSWVVVLLVFAWSGCQSFSLFEADIEYACVPPVPTATAFSRPSTPAVTASLPVSPVGATPSSQQLAWQRGEMYLFVHFGVNTFTNREWGTGHESPALFDPEQVDAGQWARIAKNTGFSGLVLTAKHHDGFALWPTAYSEHSVKNSSWLNGKGDVVRLASDAARDAGLAFGLYVSPWDLHEKTYGTPAYDDFFVNQLEELLTGYGPIFEVWLDGAHASDASFDLDFPRYHQAIRQLQPEALIAITGPDIRWTGDESGYAPDPQFSAVDETTWYPIECDVTNRPSWFWKTDETHKIKPLSRLLSIYFNCVGHNGVLLLNVAPDRTGRFPVDDIHQLYAFRAALDRIFRDNLLNTSSAQASSTRENRPEWQSLLAIDGNDDTFWVAEDGETSATLEFDPGGCISFNTIELKEPIQFGERIRSYRVDASNNGAWETVSAGSSVGHKKLDIIPTVTATKIRIVIESSTGSPAIQEFGLYHNPFPVEPAPLSKR